MSVDVPLPVEPTPLHPVDPPTPGLSAAACVERVGAAVEALAGVAAVRHELTSTDLAALTRSTLAVLQLAESAAVGLVGDAIQRGLVAESTAAGPAQWVGRLGAGEPVTNLLPDTGPGRVSGPLVPIDHPDDADTGAGVSRNGAEVGAVRDTGTGTAFGSESGTGFLRDVGPDDRECGRVARCRVPGLEPGVVSRIAKVATACTQRRHRVVAEALVANQVGVAATKTALTEVEKLLPVLPASTHDTVYQHFLALPPGSGARAIRELSSRVVATFADEDFLTDLDAKLDAAESATWGLLPNGMERLIADLAPFHAAQVRHALNALSAPAPGNTCCADPFHRHTGDPTGELDPRSAPKRAADALMMLITTAAPLIDNDTTVPTSGQAKIVVTIDHDTLTGRLLDRNPDHPAARTGSTGPPGTGPGGTDPPGVGFGRTEDGTALHAHHIRQLACDADILPMILGSDSEPLDVGRKQRLVKHGMRDAVVQRDRHCTYPGCGRPPAWCQIHHVIPWQHGGPTALHNSALLCQRHHTIVHRDQYSATVTATSVVWDLTPGRMRVG